MKTFSLIAVLLSTVLPTGAFAQYFATTRSAVIAQSAASGAAGTIRFSSAESGVGGGLTALFPKLLDSADSARNRSVLERVLAQSRLNPRELASLPAATKDERVTAALSRYARSLAAESTTKIRTSDDPVRSIVELSALKYQFEDLRDAARLLEPANQDDINRVLEPGLDGLATALRMRSDALVEKIMTAFPADAVWQGRTAIIPVSPDGASVALKFAKPRKGVEDEGPSMGEARHYGLAAPTPLPSRRGYIREVPFGQGPQDKPSTAFMAYLLPGELAGDFFTYLGDALPKDWSRDQKSQAIRSSTMNAVDGLVRLFKNGSVHGSLAPLSHSEASWRWDYWRPAGSTMFSEISRIGPSSIHNWAEGLAYANIRLSGLADFEHLQPLPQDEESRRAAVGQNVFELSMLVVRAGYRNRLSAGSIAEILTEALQRHAAGASGGRSIEFNRGTLHPLLIGIVRRFYIFYTLADTLPRFLIELFNAAVSTVSNRAIPEGAALVMPGEIVHPLIMYIVKPYVEALSGGVHKSAELSWLTPKRKPIRDSILALLFGFETAPYWGRLGRRRVASIDNPDVNMRRKTAVSLMGRQDGSSLARIGTLLSDQDTEVRRLAIDALKGRRDAASLALIEELLHNPDMTVRRHAAAALGGRQDAAALPLIGRVLHDEEVSDAAADALAGRQDAASLALIKTLLDDPDIAVRHYAAAGLAGRRDADSMPIIENLLGDNRDFNSRRYAAGALEGRLDNGVIPLIAKALDDAEFGVRQFAAEALIDRQDEYSLALIKKALLDEDAAVRRYAGEALKRRRANGVTAFIKKILSIMTRQ